MELLEAIEASTDPVSRQRLLDQLVSEFGHKPEIFQAIRQLKAPQRLYTVARLLERSADRAEIVEPCVEALTAGYGRGRQIQLMIDLQHRLQLSRVLDARLDRLLARTRLVCPKCGQRFRRERLIRHLWFRHRLLFHRGQAFTPRATVERAINEAAQSDEPEVLARAYSLSLTFFQPLRPVQVHQAMMARVRAEGEDLEVLAAYGRELCCGLCPRCYAAAPERLPAMPPPLVVRPGRLVGEGFEMDLGAMPPRRACALGVSLAVAMVGLLLTIFLPSTAIPPLATALGTVVISLLALLLLGSRRRQWTRHDAVDAAWRDLALRVGRSPAAVRFLTRLCRTSLNHGRPEQRFETVWSHVEHAAVLCGKSDAAMQWFAALRVLQAHDTARVGRDWVPNLAGMIAPVFRAEITPLYAETVAETLLNSGQLNEGDTARLRVALLNDAFHAGLAAADLVVLAKACPNLGTLLTLNETYLAGLHAVWKQQDGQPWERIAPVRDVFDFIGSPASREVMARYPDTLLVHMPRGPAGGALGPVVVRRLVVSLAGRTVRELNTPIRVERAGNEGRLIFGNQSITVPMPLAGSLAKMLAGWLHWLASLPAAADSAPGDRVLAILAPVLEECRLCGQRFIPRAGVIGPELPQARSDGP